MGGRGQDFSALQQHIDELTTAKFELQRGMAQQGKLAASLAAENMRLSEDFNQQVPFTHDRDAEPASLASGHEPELASLCAGAPAE